MRTLYMMAAKQVARLYTEEIENLIAIHGDGETANIIRGPVGKWASKAVTLENHYISLFHQFDELFKAGPFRNQCRIVINSNT